MTDDLRTVRVSHRFSASPERVYDAWLDPAIASRFLFTTPTGTIVRAEIDARVGGKLHVTDRRPEGDVEHVGEYLVLDRPRRIAFSFGVPKYSPLFTKVTLTFTPTDDGGCEVELVHEGVLPDFADRTAEGWGKMLRAIPGAL